MAVEIADVIEERLDIGYLTRIAILRLDDEIHLTFYPQEKERELKSIAPLRRGWQRVV